MKFGETLHRRSIPAWSINNVDYNDLKAIIKSHTGPDGASGASHASGTSKVDPHFEDILYAELARQHERVNDFIDVKSGEISRRLTALQRQLSRPNAKHLNRNGTGLAGRSAEKFARLDLHIDQIGVDIEALVRFTRTNALALHKLLKKCRKWTGSRALGDRFRTTIMDNEMSFSKRNFDLLFMQYADALETLRASFAVASESVGMQTGTASATQPETSHKQPASNATLLHDASQTQKPMMLDTLFAVTPVDQRSIRAAYWIHQDNILNVQIMLMRYASEQKSKTRATAQSSRNSTLPSATGSRADLPEMNRHTSRTADAALVLCDDLHNFEQNRRGETIAEIEASPATSVGKAITQFRIAKDNWVVMADASARKERKKNRAHSYSISTISGQDGVAILDTFQDGPGKAQVYDQITQQRIPSPKPHHDVRALVKLQFYRSRYLGLQNSVDGGLWAMLDQEISMRTINNDEAPDRLFEIENRNRHGTTSFPHAVLEVRVEGSGSSDLIDVLDKSHLAERVRGFSLESHAIAVLYQTRNVPQPYWMSALKQDIRKLPREADVNLSRGSKSRSARKQPGTAHTSISARSTQTGRSNGDFSAIPTESSATSIPEKVEENPIAATRKKSKRGKKAKPLLRKPRSHFAKPQNQQRYWNEFDDGSECGREDDYVIYVSPPNVSSNPGSNVFTKFWNRVWGGSLVAEKGINSPRHNATGSTTPASSEEGSSLLAHRASLPADRARHYSAFPSEDTSSPRTSRNRELTQRLSAIFFALSLLSLLLAATFTLIRRRKKTAARLDIGVIFSIAASLITGMLGLFSFMMRHARQSWAYRINVFLIFGLVAVLDIALLLVASNQLG